MVKTIQAEVPALALVTVRCGIAALFLLGAWALSGGLRGPRPTAPEWGTLAVLGLLGNTAFQLCMVVGLRYTSPAHSSLLIALNPVFAALLARLWLGESIGRGQFLGILVALGGVSLIVAPGQSGPGDSALVGDLLSVGAALAWALYAVLGKSILARRPALEVTTWAMVFGTLPLLVVGLPGLAAVEWSALSLWTWLLLGYLSVITLGVSYLLWYWALARASTARVVVYSYLNPVVATALAIAVGQDVLTAPLVAGAGAVIGGVLLAQRGPA